MGSRRANPVDGLNYNPRTAISFLDAANSLQFFSWPTFSLSFLKKLTRFPFISPSSLVYFYSNNQQVHLRENEFLRPRSSHYEAVEQPRDGRNKSKEVLLSGVCESITAKFLITRRQETVAADDVRIVVAAHALYYLRFNARNFNNIILSCVQLRVTRIPFRIIAPPPPISPFFS